MTGTKTLQVYLIEDNESYSDLLVKMLEKSEDCSFEVSRSYNLSDGIRYLTNNRVDAVILDLDLPDSSGLDTINTLCSKIRDIPVIVLTGSENEKIMLKSFSLGAQDYLIKGEVKTKELIRSILGSIERFRKYSNRVEEKSTERGGNYFESIINSNADGIIVIERLGRVIYLNDAACRILNRKREELIGKPFGMPVVDGEKTEIEIVQKTGRQSVIEMRSSETEFSGEKIYVVSLREITEHKRLREHFENLSVTDSQTKLYNRRGFESFAEQHIKLSGRSKKPFLLAFMDLDGLKQINDTFGHDIGNIAINDIANVLKSTFRESDIISRWGGDEFAVLISNTSPDSINEILERLKAELDEYKSQNSRPFELSVSLGISTYDPENPATLDELVRNADKSMYEMKASAGKGDSKDLTNYNNINHNAQ